MSTTPSSLTPPAPAQLSSALGTVLDEVLCALETVRVADRTMASDGERLTWIEKVTEAERRVSALKAVLIGEADEAGSAMRVRHTPLRDWLAGSGQESPRRAAAALWKARELEQRPRVREAATSGRISLEQAAAINEALNGLPTSLDKAQHQQAEDLILVAATHTSPEKLRTMAESLVTSDSAIVRSFSGDVCVAATRIRSSACWCWALSNPVGKPFNASLIAAACSRLIRPLVAASRTLGL